MLKRLLVLRFSVDKPSESQSALKIMKKVEQVAISEEEMKKQVDLRIKDLETLHRKTQ